MKSQIIVLSAFIRKYTIKQQKKDEDKIFVEFIFAKIFDGWRYFDANVERASVATSMELVDSYYFQSLAFTTNDDG